MKKKLSDLSLLLVLYAAPCSIAVVLCLLDLVFVRGPEANLSPDEIRHLLTASNIWNHGVFGDAPDNPTAADPVLYPLLLSPFIGVFGEIPRAALLVQVLGLVASICLQIWFSRKHFGSVPAFATGVLLATYLPLLRLTVRFLTEALAIFLLSLALLLTDRVFSDDSKTSTVRWGVLAGVAFALLGLTRVICVPLFLIACFLLLVSFLRGQRNAAVGAAAIIAGFAICYAPWVVRNQLSLNRTIVLTDKGNELHFRFTPYWIAEFVFQGDTLQDARYKSYERARAMAAGKEVPVPRDLSRLSETYFSHSLFRLGVMLGVHPSLEIPFPFGGQRMLVGHSIVRWANYLWSLVFWILVLIGTLRVFMKRDLSQIHCWCLPMALIGCYSLVHVIPRYQLVPYAALTIVAGAGVATLLSFRGRLNDRPGERVVDGNDFAVTTD